MIMFILYYFVPISVDLNGTVFPISTKNTFYFYSQKEDQFTRLLDFPDFLMYYPEVFYCSWENTLSPLREMSHVAA